MAKELEAFENIMRIYGETNSLEGTYDDFLTIKKALQRLEAIDNAKPNEAMKTLNRLAYEDACCRCEYYNDDKCYNKDECVWMIIKQALIEAQEQEKVLKIVFNKGLPLAEIKMIKQSENYKNYIVDYSWVNWKNASIPKTKDEFELIKRWLDNDTL